MLRATCQLLVQPGAGTIKTANTNFALEFVRWRRKPRWVPVAKSKRFRVPERKIQSEEERAELMRLHNNYKTQLRSVRLFLREDVKRQEETTTVDHVVLTPEQEEAQFQRCLEENAAWNATIAAEREQRLQKEREAKKVYVQERLEAAMLRDEERRERADEIVRREKELAKTFISRENLDAAIETALANPVDYNFCIDLSGNIYRGRATNPSNAPTSSEPQVEPLKQKASN